MVITGLRRGSGALQGSGPHRQRFLLLCKRSAAALGTSWGGGTAVGCFPGAGLLLSPAPLSLGGMMLHSIVPLRAGTCQPTTRESFELTIGLRVLCLLRTLITFASGYLFRQKRGTRNSLCCSIFVVPFNVCNGCAEPTERRSDPGEVKPAAALPRGGRETSHRSHRSSTPTAATQCASGILVTCFKNPQFEAHGEK